MGLGQTRAVKVLATKTAHGGDGWRGPPPGKWLCTATARECERPAAALESPASGSTPSTSGQAGVVFAASVDRSVGPDDPVNQPDLALHVERREAPACDKEAPLPDRMGSAFRPECSSRRDAPGANECGAFAATDGDDRHSQALTGVPASDNVRGT